MVSRGRVGAGPGSEDVTGGTDAGLVLFESFEMRTIAFPVTPVTPATINWT